MANYVKFKQGLKKDFNTTNQPLTNGMIYFVIDENNNGSIYYDTIVDGKQATKNGAVHRVKFSGLPIKITGSVTGIGVISKDGETIEINTSTNHSHGLAHQDFTVTLSNDDTNLKWTRLGNQNGEGFWLKSIKGDVKAPAWFQPNYGAGIAFGGGSTKGIISVKYNEPSIKFAGGNGDAPVWYFTITGANDKTYDLSKIGGHSSDSAKLDHNVTFKIASTADATNGANGTKTDLSGPAVNLYLPTKISGFDLLQASRFQGNADSATYATSAGYAKGLFLNPETRQEDMNFNLADAKYIKRVTYSMATSTTKKNKPPIGDANILSFGWDNSGYGSQLAIQNGSAGHLAVRGSGSTNGASSWGEWSTVLDSSNYTSYINNYYWANVKVSTTSSTETKPTFNTAYTSNWWRSTGKTGWWNDTYSGGIAMEDETYVKVAGNKSFLIPNGSLKIGGNGNILFATGYDDATLKIYGQTNTDFGAETIVIQTCFDNRDPQTSGYTTQYANRCNLLLQPRGGQVYIGKNLTTLGDVGYKLLIGGNQWIDGNLVFNNDLHIQVNTKSYNQDIIAAYDSPNAFGIDLVIGSGATTIVGAGESAAAMYSAGIKNNKNLYLSADGNVFLYTNCDTIANRRYACFDTNRNFYPDADNSGSIGTFDNRWNTGWFNTLNLAGATSSTIANSTPRIIFQEKNGANKIQAVGIVYTDTDDYRPTKGLKIMDVDGSDGKNVWLEVQGDIWTGGNIRINNDKSLIQNQGDTSNYTEAVKWYKGGKSQNTYDPQIGQHNTGNDGTGSICILPYATATAPWGGSVGLFIAKSRMLLDNYRVPTTGNSGGTVGSATVPVYSDGGILKTITSYSGNAATATTASKLSRNAGSATKPIYFSDGVPVQCNDTLEVNISGNAASATYTTQLLGVQNNGSNTPHSATEGNLIRAVWNVKGDSRWYLKAGTYNCRVNYADNAGNADTVDGYHAADLFSGGYKTTLDLSTLNNNLYYPVTGAAIPINGYHKIKVSVHLNSGTKPSWATHNSGFTTNVELYTTAYGCGTTHGETIVLNDSYNFTNCGQVVGFTQNGNTSTPVLWLRGGGKYFVECDYNASWTIRTSLYYTQGSSSDTYYQTVEPQSSYPGFKAGDGGGINGVIKAGQVYGAVWNDYAEYRQTKECISPGYCVIETGKGDLIKSSERLQPGANIVSDTFGFAIGETEQTKTPLAVSGRVLAYPYEDRDSYQAGDPVCSGSNGTISKMTREEVREYPDRIIGTVSEIPDYEVWGTGNVKVNNRIWIKVK